MSATAPPRQYVLRKPSGNPTAARAMASAYDDLAADVAEELRCAVVVLDAVQDSWRGAAASAVDDPARVVHDDAQRVCRGLRRSAEDLRHYAHRLEQAHESHGWSIGKLVALGALVAVGAAAVVVTVGAAAPAEAAAAAAAVEGAEAAAATAGAASAGVAADLAAWQSLLGAVRPLTPFLLPHVVSAASSAGVDALSQLLSTHHLDAHALEVSSVAGFAGSATGSVIEERLLATPTLLRRVAEGGAWAASGAVASYADNGAVAPADVAALGLTGVVARDVRFGVDEARLMWKLRVPQLPRGFDSKKEWRRFVVTLYDGLDRAGYPGAVVAFRGSSVTGFNWRFGHAFDSLYRSDWDLAIVHRDLLDGAAALKVPLRDGGARTAPVYRAKLARLGVGTLASTLNDAADRKVTWMLYRDTAAVARRGAHLFVPRP